MIDKNIVEIFITSSGKLKSCWKTKLNDTIKEYLNDRYDDSTCLLESIIRIYLHINKHPLCPICGKPVKFTKRISKPFSICCSSYCSKKLNGSKSNIKNRYDKIKQTLREKYNINNVFQLNSIKEKIAQTKQLKYGDKNYSNRERACQTILEKFGGKSYFANSTKHEQSIKKKECTCLKKYGVTNVFANNIVKEKIKHTNIAKYGVDNPFKSPTLMANKLEKEYNTKKKNNSFNISKPEDESYAILKERYLDVVTQYKDDRYPFACDFYIPSLDLFIECNYHWTHGGKPYEGTEDDKQIVEKWKAKNTKFYDNAIQTWTVRDVNKRNIAKQNKLNYIEFWNLNELLNWMQ